VSQAVEWEVSSMELRWPDTGLGMMGLIYTSCLNLCIPRQSKKAANSRKMQPGRNPTDRTPYRFRKIVIPSSITATSAAEGLYAFSFTAGAISEIASFTSVFDQYRIAKVTMKLLPASQLATTVTSVPAYSHVFIVTDYDDDSALASASLALNYQNCSVIYPGQSHVRSIVPHVNEFVQGSGTSAARSVASPWLDCAVTDIKHYGFKIGVTQSTTTNQSYWVLYLMIDFDFRMIR
jgi:hypothetical protein